MYKVVCRFADMQDGNHIYEVGDVFPWDGRDVADDRIAELASKDNKIGVPLIKAIKTARKAEGKEIIKEVEKTDSEPSEKPKKRR